MFAELAGVSCHFHFRVAPCCTAFGRVSATMDGFAATRRAVRCPQLTFSQESHCFQVQISTLEPRCLHVVHIAAALPHFLSCTTPCSFLQDSELAPICSDALHAHTQCTLSGHIYAYKVNCMFPCLQRGAFHLAFS